MTLEIGQVLNQRYQIVELLGNGGFGAVYRVWDLNLQKSCALKENLELTPATLKQFQKEAQLLSSLSHPNLPRVTDHFVIPGQGQFLVMDYIEGEDLQQKLNRAQRPLNEHQAIVWILQVCQAIDYLHTQMPPIIHRDIKPANIRITLQGKAYLVDFGIAKVYDPNLRTTAGSRAVTPGYSPFEQYGQKSTDVRTDIYALGATLYALLSGKAPTDSTDRIAGTPLPPPRSFNSLITPRVEKVILKSMEILPEHRYQSVAELVRDLDKPYPPPDQTPTIKVSMARAVTVVRSALQVRITSKKLGRQSLYSLMVLAVVGAGVLAGMALLPLARPERTPTSELAGTRTPEHELGASLTPTLTVTKPFATPTLAHNTTPTATAMPVVSPTSTETHSTTLTPTNTATIISKTRPEPTSTSTRTKRRPSEGPKDPTPEIINP